MTATLPRRGFLGRMVAALTGGAWLAGSQANAAGAQIEDLQFISEVRLFAGITPPAGWLLCQGQLLDPNDISYSALFSLIGTIYGGDGQNTFALPDLRSRTPLHPAFGFDLGQIGGTEQTTLLASQFPAHTHALAASAAPGGSSDPGGRIPARNAAGSLVYGATANNDLAASALQSAGGSQPHPNIQPYLGIQFMICFEGIFPSQS